MPPSPTSHTSTLRYLLQFMRPYYRQLLLAFLFLMVGRIALSLEPVWLKKIADQIQAGTTLQTVTQLLLVYFSLSLLQNLFDFLRDYIFAPAQMGITRTISEKLYSHLLALSVGYHHDQRLGGVSRKITRGGRAMNFLMDFFSGNILPVVFQLAFVTGLLLKFYPAIYALIIFITIIAYTLFTLWATEKRQVYRISTNQADDEVSGLESDALTNIDTIKYFNNEPYLKKRYWPAITKRHDLEIKSNRLYSLVAGGQNLILLLGTSSVLYLGTRQAVAGQLTIGDLILLTSYIFQLSSPLGFLGAIYRQIKDNLVDLSGMVAIMHEEISIQEPTKPTALKYPKGKIHFDNLHFNYSNGRQVLKGLTFTAQPGEKVAFVGPSGVGKSTIVRLLFRLYEPTKGRILIDDIPLEKLDKESRASLMAIVPQEPILFNTTVAENIRFARPEATQEEVESAARLANAHDFITHLTQGYETVVGERGVKLSGGEKQRVAIARAVLRDPRILVFDEATSALDSHNEGVIQASLEKVAAGRTSVTIAHRLSTITHADKIYVLKEGKIVESGRHPELLAKKGLYAEMWRTQAKERQAEKTFDKSPAVVP